MNRLVHTSLTRLPALGRICHKQTTHFSAAIASLLGGKCLTSRRQMLHFSAASAPLLGGKCSTSRREVLHFSAANASLLGGRCSTSRRQVLHFSATNASIVGSAMGLHHSFAFAIGMERLKKFENIFLMFVICAFDLYALHQQIFYEPF